MKKRQILNLTILALYVVMLVVEIFAIIGILRLNMLPTGLLILVIAVFLAITVGIGFLLFYKSKRLKGKKARAAVRTRRIVAGFVIILMLIISIVICIVTGDVLKTLDAVSMDDDKPVVVTRTIYVQAEDAAQKLEDASSYTFGYVKNYDTECTQQAVAELQKAFGATPATASYDNVFKMVDALLGGQVDAIIMNSGYVTVLEYEEAYADFSEKTKVLADVEIAGESGDAPENPTDPEDPGLSVDPENTDPVTTEPTEPEAPITPDNLEPFVVYLSGSDTRNAMLKGGRSDVNILAVVNPNTRQVLLINSPRDFYVANPSGDGAMDKLTHCGIYGVKCSMKALGDLYDEEVDYHLQINFEGFKKAIDAMGGITVYSDYSFTAIRRTKIVKGENYLTGQQALDFARERYTLAGGDNARGKNQMKVIKAVIDKATSGTTVINNYSAIISSLDGMFVMSIPKELISSLMKNQLSDMSGWDVFSYATKGTGTMAETYSMPGMKLSCIKPNEDSVAKATKLINKVMKGEELTEAMVNG